ncbi:hypothetical protein GQX73_g3950 [Xylaria multiplex]|uniref:Heterokaryon incompatibility domain-containing protein n=1 Tax=Xylaria multiplex TaxID=323545 RepID=A0A7C8IQC1_9PEZI|nr:hypothetical protein GQX73_g3950 [Xylaria multiplex]
MRLLNTENYTLETFMGVKKPPYAILSHTWGENEVLFEDLQELIAPDEVIFFNAKWESIGTRKSLSSTISTITKIDISLLQGGLRKPDLDKFSVHTRMTWAYERETTRPEDRAYSLMGIFDVHMPLLYGEGGDKAFERLQGEIIKGVNDQSILLHRGYRHILATSPDDFLPIPTFRRSPSVSVLERVNFELRIFESVFADDPSSLCRPAVQLTRVGSEDKFYRSDTRLLKVRLGTGDQAEVVDVSCRSPTDERIVGTLDQRGLQRKVMEICDSSGWQALVPGTIMSGGLHLRLLPIVHKTASQLFDYAACYHEKNGPLIPIHYIESFNVFRDLRLMAAISLRHLGHENSSVVVLLFGQVLGATQEALWETKPPLDLNPFRIDLRGHYIFPYLVNLRDWLVAARGEHFDPLNMSLVHDYLPGLPMVRKHYTGLETVYNVVLTGAPEENFRSQFSMSTADRLRITVSLSRTLFLENEVLNFKAEIAEETSDEPEEISDESEVTSDESEEDRNTFSGFRRKEITSPQRSRRTTRRPGRYSYQYPRFDYGSE